MNERRQDLIRKLISQCYDSSNKLTTPPQADGASILQRCRAAGDLTLAAFAKYLCKRRCLAQCSQE